MPEQFFSALMLTYGAGAFGAVWNLDIHDRSPVSRAVSTLLLPAALVAAAVGCWLFIREFGIGGGIIGLALTAVVALVFNRHVAVANDSIVTGLGILSLAIGAGLAAHILLGGPVG